MSIPKVPPKLAAEWRKKLEDSGFEDIEDARANLRRSTSSLRRSVGIAEDNLRAEYYRRAAQWDWERVWPSRIQRMTWRLHAEGKTIYEIERALANMPKHGFRWVLKRIHEERARMFEGYQPDAERELRGPFEEELATFDWLKTRGEPKGSGQGGGEG